MDRMTVSMYPSLRSGDNDKQEMKRRYYVYILASRRIGTLHTGVTGDLFRRVYEHKKKEIKGFTKRYNVNRLVHFEETDDISIAITREKQIKG